MNNEYDRRNYGICSKLTIKTIERSQLTSLRYVLALIRLQKFLKMYRASESRIEMKYKQKIKFIVYFEQIYNVLSVFVVDFEEVSADWEAKEGNDYRNNVVLK